MTIRNRKSPLYSLSRLGHLGTTTGVALLVASAALAQAPTQKPAAAARGPWAMTVALPTACYSSQDQFDSRIQTRFARMDPMQMAGIMQQANAPLRARYDALGKKHIGVA